MTPSLPDGCISANGQNTTIFLSKDEAQAIKSGKVNNFTNALKTPKQADRQRFPMKASAVYLNN